MIIPPPLPPDYLSLFPPVESPLLNQPVGLTPSYQMTPPPLPSGNLNNQQMAANGSQITSQGGDLSQGTYTRESYNIGTPDLYDFQPHRYSTSKGESSYSHDTGILVIPVMGPVGTAPVTSRTHAPIGFRTYAFEHVKDGTPPILPAMANTPSGDIFLGGTIGFPTPTQNIDNTLRFGQHGEYTFVQPEVRDSTSVFPIDRHPMPTMIDSLGVDKLFDLDGQPGLLDMRWQANGVDAKVLTSYGIVK